MAPELPAISPPIEDTELLEVRQRGLLDAGKRREIVAILSLGCSRATAAQYVGCHAVTIGRTAMRDPEFGRQIRQAESLLEVKHLRNIEAAAKDTRYWRAAAWALERKFPDRWGQRHMHALSPEQVSQALQQFAQLVIDEVKDDDTREHILNRLDELAAQLSDDDNEADGEDF